MSLLRFMDEILESGEGTREGTGEGTGERTGFTEVWILLFLSLSFAFVWHLENLSI